MDEPSLFDVDPPAPATDEGTTVSPASLTGPSDAPPTPMNAGQPDSAATPEPLAVSLDVPVESLTAFSSPDSPPDVLIHKLVVFERPDITLEQLSPFPVET